MVGVGVVVVVVATATTHQQYIRKKTKMMHWPGCFGRDALDALTHTES